MKHIDKEILIAAPIARVYEMMADPNQGPEWIPSLVEVSDVRGAGEGCRYHWRYKMGGVPLKGESQIVEASPNEKLVVKTTGGARSTWTYRVAQQDGNTRFRLVVDYEIPVPVLGAMAETLLEKRNDRELEMAVHNAKDILEHRAVAEKQTQKR